MPLSHALRGMFDCSEFIPFKLPPPTNGKKAPIATPLDTFGAPELWTGFGDFYKRHRRIKPPIRGKPRQGSGRPQNSRCRVAHSLQCLSCQLPEDAITGRKVMAVARVSKITASSPKGFQEAAHEGMQRAAKTLRGITGFEVVSMKGKVEKGKVVEYRVTLEVTFILE
jgi:dodecin